MNKYFSLSNLSTGMKDEEKKIATALTQLGMYRLYNAMGKTSDIENFINYNYEEKNEIAVKSLMQYCAKYAGYGDNVDTETLKSPRMRRDGDFSKKFFSIIEAATSPIISAVVNMFFEHIAEVKNSGWGDSFLFKIPSKDIFQVNVLARGINRGSAQRVYDENLTLTPTLRECTVSIDWYQMAAGRYDIGDYLFRVGRSFAADMSQLTYNTLDATFASLPAPLQYSGTFDSNELDLMAQRLQAVNGQKIYGLGSLSALAKVLPSNDFLKLPLAEEWATMGYCGTYRRISFLEVPQVLVPNTGNTTLDLGISLDRIYLMPMIAEKPIKIGIEGSTMVFETNSETSADNTVFVTTQQSYGCAIATASRYGIYEISA